MKDTNYITINGWMVNQLNLKGYDLIIFAIIYGFSQDGISEFTGSITYLQDWTGASRRTVIYSLQRLVESGLLIKNEMQIAKNLKMVKYRADIGQCKNCTGSAKNAQGQCKNYTGSGAKFAPNNTNNNITKDKDKHKSNQFNNFSQRDYDYNELMKKLKGN